MREKNHNNIIVTWLLFVTVSILLIIIIGGITRLTGSGLSMVDWKPLMGSIPPLSHGDWLKTFSLYQSSPQYQLVNLNMSLASFKVIFFWEYLHRMIARFIGLALIIPFIFFRFKNIIPKWLNKHIIIMIIGVIFQGILGWFMVKSGLIHDPEVSHYRLAAHLTTALLLLQYIIWIILNLVFKGKKTNHKLATALRIWSIGIIIQIIYGAFTAGKKAGWGYNTYPKMGDKWLPDAAFMYDGFIANIFENPVMIQFVHRHLGVVLSIIFIGLGIKLLKANETQFELRISCISVFTILALQILLGILTLILKVPITLAVLHQLTGAILLVSITCLNYFLTYRN